jgi:hypothetical protein
MNNKKTLTLLFVLVLAVAQFGFGQLSQKQTSHRTIGYLDPVSGSFVPLQSKLEADSLTPVTPTTGTLTFHFKISVKTAIPKNSVISCNANADVVEVATDSVFSEAGAGIATGSGTSYTCSVVIHYSWGLTTPGTDMLQLSSSASMEYGFQVTASNGTAVLVVPAIARVSQQPIGVIAVPASGASTTENVSVTL